MKKYKVYVSDDFEEHVQNTASYFKYKFRNEQAVEHLLNGILKAQDELEMTADLMPLYREETQEHFIRVDSMRYKIVYTIDEENREVWLHMLVHDWQDR